VRRLAAIVGLFVLALAAACGYDPHPQNGKLPCTSHCPDGYRDSNEADAKVGCTVLRMVPRSSRRHVPWAHGVS
jgi:hypothetical protein